MGILGITNRTENWRTAQYFSPFFASESARARLVERLLPSAKSSPSEVKLELYWKGMRDYLHEYRPRDDAQHLADLYQRLFPDLRSKVCNWRGRHGQPRPLSLKCGNYDVSMRSARKLHTNLVNTEIDIVLESKTHLFIGEAKHESAFGADGNLVLAHQLIRQYVMARILVVLQGGDDADKDVVPFVVWDKPQRGRQPLQLQFMIEQGWMDSRNILSWAEVEKLARDT